MLNVECISDFGFRLPRTVWYWGISDFKRSWYTLHHFSHKILIRFDRNGHGIRGRREDPRPARPLDGKRHGFPDLKGVLDRLSPLLSLRRQFHLIHPNPSNLILRLNIRPLRRGERRSRTPLRSGNP